MFFFLVCTTVYTKFALRCLIYYATDNSSSNLIIKTLEEREIELV